MVNRLFSELFSMFNIFIHPTNKCYRFGFPCVYVQWCTTDTVRALIRSAKLHIPKGVREPQKTHLRGMFSSCGCWALHGQFHACIWRPCLCCCLRAWSPWALFSADTSALSSKNPPDLNWKYHLCNILRGSYREALQGELQALQYYKYCFFFFFLTFGGPPW